MRAPAPTITNQVSGLRRNEIQNDTLRSADTGDARRRYVCRDSPSKLLSYVVNGHALNPLSESSSRAL